MSRFNVFLLILASFLIWIMVAPQTPAQTNSVFLQSLSLAPPTPTMTPSPTPTPMADPQTLIVPKLSIHANIEEVGTDTDGRMDVPKDFDNVGWYHFGPKPGEKGSAVIAGHLDKITGAPAVFYYLSQLEIGDELSVIDAIGKEHKFRVTNKDSYNFDQVPLDSVFNNTDKPRLNLITCGGNWNLSQRNYSHRTIIYTALIN